MRLFCARACHEAKSEDTRGETMLKDFRRRYHAAAYRTLIAVISCTQTEKKFYSTFLFRDNIAKVRRRLVDFSALYGYVFLGSALVG